MKQALYVMWAMSAALVAGACGPKAGPSEPAAGAACPGPDGLYAVVWGNAFGGDTYGAPAGDHWQLPLGYKAREAGAVAGPLTEANLLANGMRTAPDTLWIYNNDELSTTPCKATKVATVGVRMDEGPLDQIVGFASYQGCGWTDGKYGYTGAVAGAAAPAGCGFVASTSQGAYVGTDGEPYRMPALPVVPPPADIAPALRAPTAEECGACTLLWSDARTASSPQLVEFSATWMTPDPGESQCNWGSGDDHGVFVAGATGPTRVEIDRSFSLAGAFISNGALVAALVYDVGETGIWPYENGSLRTQPLFEAYLNHEEDSLWRSHAPYCGP